MDELKRRLQSFDKIFYLTDNCGEVIFDLFVIEKLKEMGKIVVVGSKSEPILNDVTAEDLKSFSDVDVIPTGNVVGTALEHLSPGGLYSLIRSGMADIIQRHGQLRDHV